jgi:hypothetical protein
MRRKLNEWGEQKTLFLGNVAGLYAHPRFNVEEPTMNPRLLSTFYDIAIDVTKTLTIREENFSYYKGNYSAHNVENKTQLLSFLALQKENPQRHDSRYMMGFRSVYFILWQNIDKIDATYMEHLNAKLAPF